MKDDRQNMWEEFPLVGDSSVWWKDNEFTKPSKDIYKLYVEFQRAGFTKWEAMTLVTRIIQASMEK